VSITEHAPKTFYKNNPSSNYTILLFLYNGNEVVVCNCQVMIKSQEIIVDPWVAIAPTFATQLGLCLGSRERMVPAMLI
jgi:hypothetical protein